MTAYLVFATVTDLVDTSAGDYRPWAFIPAALALVCPTVAVVQYRRWKRKDPSRAVNVAAATVLVVALGLALALVLISAATTGI